MIQITDQDFYPNKTWDSPIPPNTGYSYSPELFRSFQWVELFDQNGYRLTPIEQEYSVSNNQPYVYHRDEKSIRKTWMKDSEPTTGVHLNHAFLFERKGYSGDALEQLRQFAKVNNLLYKLINYKGKWGVDLSIDYVDKAGNSIEILHFEYDGYDLEEIQQIKGKVESIIATIDWTLAAKDVLKKKSEWIDLEFFQQSKWKTDYFGLPAERYKILAWE